MRLPWQFDQEKWDREHRWWRLGMYNAERGRGIVHSAAYDAEMAVEQAVFEEWRTVRDAADRIGRAEG